MELDNGHPPTETSRNADHLCVFVHGLWGNPSHLDYVTSSLRERYSEDRLHILSAKRNAGNFTYDGIEVGGERVAHEVEEALEELGAAGHHIKKLSMVGYSLGGLVARYALGLLYSRGWLDKLEPVNFTTFASPHVGVRNPQKGAWGFLWNNVGPHTISISGKQLFMIDTFRDSGKPLLSVLADPDSIFIKALKKFKHRTVYANVVNDRSTIYYTTAISTINPFHEPDNVRINYVKGYDPVVIDSDRHILPSDKKHITSLPLVPQAQQQLMTYLTEASFQLLFTTILFVGFPIFLINSAIQTVRSQRRIRLHEEGPMRTVFGRYRVPVVVRGVQHAVEEAFEHAAADQDPDYLDESKDETKQVASARRARSSESKSNALIRDDSPDNASEPLLARESQEPQEFSTLALTPDQFAIIESLNSVGFRKHPVYIHNHRHSHAAIIVRMPKPGFDEGKIVIKHWLDQVFEL
ncbi:lipase/serine esterase [Aspergillus eucalypticola CBS 122712]|uniref:Lipase/serine esterase n=1 Tax=Aspergillus eucalypticola (strain CBS 122712 / IBT 29274) TaxID=1448314 RepID=A0A317UX70_ASPEC|nr:lipase/serine esterase [Aspergillus eucalypticola CBS 122712]PWY64580.1 lipase/serine esterase [Aspergillus eucalypticola CBS 122712]